MKKSKLAIILIIVLAVTGFSQSLKITKPSSRDKWVQGNPYQIVWEKTGRMNAKVKIRLFDSKGRSRIVNISDSTPNDGSFKWTIPNSIPSGDYLVRIKTLDNKAWNNSSIFYIGSGTPPKSKAEIVVLSPKAGGVYRRGKDSLLIDFKSTGVSGDVIIQLDCPNCTSSKSVILKSAYPANGSSFGYKIPSDFFAGKYYLKVYKAGGTTGKSGIFTIAYNKDEIIHLDNSLSQRTGTLKDPIKPQGVFEGVFKKEPLKNPPIVDYFKLRPERVLYKFQTELKFKFRNCQRVEVKDPDGRLIYSWSGNLNEVKTIIKNVVLPYKKSIYSIKATNKYSDFFGKALGSIKPSADKFIVTNGNRKLMGSWWFSPGEKIEFAYSFSGASTAYIKKYNYTTKRWDRAVKILNPYFYNKSGTYKHVHDSKQGKFILVVIGDDEVVSSGEIKVF